jgi:CHAD domain-containing protein
MIKSVDREGAVSVTFTLPAAVGAARVVICGDWNGWSPHRDVMDSVEGGFALTVLLEPGRSYRFRYLLDGERCENDWEADAYVPNQFGDDDSLVDLTSVAARAPETETPSPPPTETEAEPATTAQAPAGANVEREAKLMALPGLTLPDLDGLVPGAVAVGMPVRRLDATYYDTADLRLARSGITIRHRGGEPGPAWTVKLPEDATESDLTRREITFEGPAGHVPNPAADLLLASTRALALEPVARLTTVRRPTEIRDGHGQVLAEIVDDTVSVSVSSTQEPGRFREIEVELFAAGHMGRHLLETAVARLVEAGCQAEPPVPKLVRALGEPATKAPDVVVPPLTGDARVGDLVRHAIARSVGQIVGHDPGARLGDDPEDVHKLRVGTRRLRSDLHSFAPVLDPARVKAIRTELRWLGAVVGAVRDTDVLSERLVAHLADLSEPGDHTAGADRVRATLAREAATARAAMITVLRDARYLQLLDTLVDLAADPPFRETGKFSAPRSRRMAARIVQKPWRHVVDAVDELPKNPTDAQLHHVRILAKRARYAAEAAAPLLPPAATRFAAAVADLQTVLGDHQDTVLAEAWLRQAVPDPDQDPTVRQLIKVEQELRIALREQWPAVWRKAQAKKLHTWL